MSTENTNTHMEAYHHVWELVSQTFWFQDRLGDWADWKHKFDAQLATEEDLIRCASVMLESLNESYTELVPQDPGNDNETQTACCSAQMLPGQIGCIKINTFSGKEVAKQIREAMETLQGAVAYVIDLRNNKGGFIGQACHALSLFLKEGGAYILKERRFQEGYFEAVCRIEPTQFAEHVEYELRKAEDTTWGRYDNLAGDTPIVVLINGRTGSAAELFAACLRDANRALLIGTTTVGKGIAQNSHDLGNGYKLVVTDGVFLPPSQQWFGDHCQTVRNGVVPHLTLALDEDGDNQMDAALAHLNTSLSRGVDCRSGNEFALAAA